MDNTIPTDPEERAMVLGERLADYLIARRKRHENTFKKFGVDDEALAGLLTHLELVWECEYWREIALKGAIPV